MLPRSSSWRDPNPSAQTRPVPPVHGPLPPVLWAGRSAICGIASPIEKSARKAQDRHNGLSRLARPARQSAQPEDWESPGCASLAEASTRPAYEKPPEAIRGAAQTFPVNPGRQRPLLPSSRRPSPGWVAVSAGISLGRAPSRVAASRALVLQSARRNLSAAVEYHFAASAL